MDLKIKQMKNNSSSDPKNWRNFLWLWIRQIIIQDIFTYEAKKIITFQFPWIPWIMYSSVQKDKTLQAGDFGNNS